MEQQRCRRPCLASIDRRVVVLLLYFPMCISYKNPLSLKLLLVLHKIFNVLTKNERIRSCVA